MAESTDYELLDMGAGRKLERFGAEILDRPSPAAEGLARSAPDRWDGATARFDHERGGSGTWSVGDRAIDPDELAWPIEHDGVRLVLQLRPSANIGVFPEQTTNWDWIAAQVRAGLAFQPDRAPRVLNLFAYTGSFTVYAADGGAVSTDTLDLSNTYLAWAERNLELNGFKGSQHQFLQADVLEWLGKMPARKWDIIVFDPPTFSNSKRMRDTLDIQRDHVWMLRCALSRLAPGGTLFFSTNMRKFKLDMESLSDVKIKNISAQTVPNDFREKRIHQCYLLQH